MKEKTWPQYLEEKKNESVKHNHTCVKTFWNYQN